MEEKYKARKKENLTKNILWNKIIDYFPEF